LSPARDRGRTIRSGILTISLGALLLIAAVAGFVIVPEHAPMGSFNGSTCAEYAGCPRTGLSHTMYDVLRVATWAALIIGALVVIVGLISYSRRPVRA
jgi:uncharacterized membrane protein HdeD (DUF308 family)